MFNYCPPIKLPDLKSVTSDDGKRYYVTPNGIRLPSVTTVVGASKKQAILDWRDRVGHEEANRISYKASSRGTVVHSLCEDYLNNKPIGNPMPDVLMMFNSIKPIIDNSITDIWYNEQSLYSEKIGLAGKVDLIAKWNGKLSIIDFKTSTRIKQRDEILDYFHQECAYALMLEDMVGQPVHQLVTLMAVENEKPLIFIEKTKNHIKGLVDVIKYYNNYK